jgi:hypothetical protein
LSHYINATGLIFGVIPMLIVFVYLWCNRGEPWRVSNFLSSLLLIGIATFMLGLLTDMIAMAETLRDQNKVTDSLFKELKTSGAIWLAIIPAVAGGVGVNILSAFLSSKKP